MSRTWIFFAAVAIGCGGAPPAPSGQGAVTSPDVVVIISLDGFRHDYPARAPTPAFDRMAREGASLGRMIPPWPSQTFPGHASLATGRRIDGHGIINNVFIDRDRGLFRYGNGGDWYDAPPLWSHATRHGVRTHVYHWVGSEGPHDGVEAAVWFPYDDETPDTTKIDTVIGWLESPADTRPGLVMSYLRGCDREGHHNGPDAAEVTACIARVDTQLGRLLDAAARLRAAPDGPGIAVFVVADHGMTRTLGSLSAGRVLEAAGIDAQVAATGPIAHVYLSDEATMASAQQALAALPHSKTYLSSSMPSAWSAWHPRRTGDLVVVADVGFRFDPKQAVPLVDLQDQQLGHHGHDPTLPDMGSVFRSWGDGVASGVMFPQARAIDLVPTVCRLMGLPPPERLDGIEIEGVLSQ